MPRVRKTTVRRTKRTDEILHLVQLYSGGLDTPKKYNSAYAGVLRSMADKIEKVTNAYVDPELVVWLHERGRIQAEVTLGRAN